MGESKLKQIRAEETQLSCVKIQTLSDKIKVCNERYSHIFAIGCDGVNFDHF